jgi:hypothetical protein
MIGSVAAGGGGVEVGNGKGGAGWRIPGLGGVGEKP